jgi:outer membrane lipoprotein-sorting protein
MRHVRSSWAVRFAVLSLVAGLAGLASYYLLVGGNESRSLRSYYFEASISVQPVDRLDEPQIARLRAWYEAPARWRREFGSEDPLLADMTSVQVSDGETFYYLDGPSNLFYEQAFSDDGRATYGSIGIAIPIGPVPDQLVRLWRERSQEARSHSIREDRLLGRDVEVIDLETNDGDRLSVWFDPEHSFVLRYESASSAGDSDSRQTVRAEITELRYNAKIDEARFTFEPPAGARRVEAPDAVPGATRATGSLSAGGREISVPPGFLTPGYIPEGYAVSGSGSSVMANNLVTRVETRLKPAGLRDAGGPFLTILQQVRPGGMPESLRTGASARIGTYEAYQREAAGVRRLVWYRDELVLTVKSDALPFEELQRVAESMR